MSDDKAIDLASLKKVLAAEITAMSEDLEGSAAAETSPAATGWQDRFVASGKVTAPTNARAAETVVTGRAAWQRRFVASGKIAPAPRRG